MSEETASEEIVVVPGIYQHFKGRLYHVSGVSLHGRNPEDTTQAEVIYTPLYVPEKGPKAGLRHRSSTEFLQHVDRDELNYHGPQFKLVLELPMRIWLPLAGEKFFCGNRFFDSACYALDASGSVVICDVTAESSRHYRLENVFNDIRRYIEVA